MPTNPTNRVKLYRENNERVRFLSAEEETNLRDAMKPTDWPLVTFAIHTGLRQGERFNLRWDNIDFANSVITIARSKSGKVRRGPMNDTVRALLRALPSRARSFYVFPPTRARLHLLRVTSCTAPTLPRSSRPKSKECDGTTSATPSPHES